MTNPHWLEVPMFEQISMVLKMLEPSRFDCRYKYIYPNIPKYWKRQARSNTVDTDHMPQDTVSDQDLHFAMNPEALGSSTNSTIDLFKI